MRPGLLWACRWHVIAEVQITGHGVLEPSVDFATREHWDLQCLKLVVLQEKSLRADQERPVLRARQTVGTDERSAQREVALRSSASPVAGRLGSRCSHEASVGMGALIASVAFRQVVDTCLTSLDRFA